MTLRSRAAHTEQRESGGRRRSVPRCSAHLARRAVAAGIACHTTCRGPDGGAIDARIAVARIPVKYPLAYITGQLRMPPPTRTGWFTAHGDRDGAQIVRLGRIDAQRSRRARPWIRTLLLA